MLAGVSLATIVGTQIVTRDYVIGGVKFDSIQSSNDLVADILPPPAYCIEFYLAAHEIVDTKDLAIRARLLADVERLQSEYDTRLQHWLQMLPQGELQDLIKTSSHSAHQLFEMLNSRILPLVKNDQLDEAREIVDESLSLVFAQHKADIYRAVPIAVKVKDEVASHAMQATSNLWKWLLISSTGVLSAAVFVFWLLGRSTSQRILVLQNAAAAMAVGDLSAKLESSSTDEIGNTCKSYGAVKTSLSNLIQELNRLVQSAQKGELSARADAKAIKVFIANSSLASMIRWPPSTPQSTRPSRF